MHDPLISVIVPIYNVGIYLEECLDSIVGQSWRNLEIILVDDGSTDGSGDICDEYASRDPRIRVLHTANGGISRARNLGVEASTGDFIGFVDSDDFISLEMYRMLARALAAEDAVSSGVKVANVSGVALFYDNSDRIVPMRGSSEWLRRTDTVVGPSEIVRIFAADRTNHYVWTKLYSKEVFASGLRFKEGILDEDSLFIFELSVLMRDRGWAMVEIPDIHYWYRQRNGGICGSKAVRLRIDRMRNLDRISEALKDDPELTRLVTMQKARTLVILLDDMMAAPEMDWRKFREYYSRLRAIPVALVREACPRGLFRKYGMMMSAPHLTRIFLRLKRS